CKQEKANRIVAEAIARAKARGERNIPRVLNQDELPAGQKAVDQGTPAATAGTPGAKKKGGGGSKKKSPSAPGKRRSNRQVKRKKYTEDLDIKITDDEDEPDEDVDVTTTSTIASVTGGAAGQLMGEQLKQELENPNEEDAAIVDKVLSMRVTKKEVSPGHYINAEEFFVKYKNYSYMHCEWATLEQLERDKRIHQKLKRFKTKHAQMRHLLQEEEEPFNPDYVEVDRILEESISVDKDNGEPVVYYLVKWCSLPYEDATWELKEDVDEGKVEEFRKIQNRQPRLKRTPRPPAAAWKKLEESREYKSGNVLREYQLEGVNWLLFNWYNRQNCILADEMGLGKTIQSISLLSEVFNAGIQGPFLVIAPLSTITNWEREFVTWTNMNAIVYHGSLASRQMIQQYEMYCKDDKFCFIFFRTPLQNTVEELFSLLHFLEPAQFSSESEFLRDFGNLKTEEQVQKLQAILKPMMLRRLKEDVEKNLAPKQETIIEVELTDVQKKYYRAILERNFSFLSMGATSNSNVPNLLNTMMELRKCCNHPYLITGAEEKIVAELREVYDPMAPDFHLQALVRSAGKLVLLDKLLPRLKAGGHKVLIFSQMVRCLDILEDYLINKRYLYERIDGRVRGNLRQAAIDRFSKPDSDRFVFLLCTRAGGLGINLTAADTCVIFDSDWNPQNDLQAQARCHRIGQSKAVKVYRLITRNSYEREMLDKASLKLGLDRAVLQSMSGNKESSVNGQIQQFSKKEIEDLLRKGAYAAIMDEEDEGSKFCEEDIDQILQRRATTITIESEGKGSTFSKASFVATENRTDIALDDPEFWQKWAKRADIDFDSMNRKNTLVIDTPRVRKQTRQFATLRGEGGEISDPDSDDEYPPANSRQARSSRRSERHTGNGYGRTDCFRVEKHLLVYGWGRWRDILSHARCKRRLGERDVETICRVILVFCLLHYRGDENIKSFIWELITPPENVLERILTHVFLCPGLSIPVPRGRKGKRVKAQSSFDVQKVEWIRKYNPDSLLLDDSYRKHLKHQCNKVLLRVRMLYYLRQEVIGEHADSVLRGADASRDVDIWMPEMEQQEVPSGWWDAEADRSLLVGVFKHGYEMYTTMRADPCLCFLERAGRPDDQAIDAEQHSADYSEDPEFKPASRHTKDLYEEDKAGSVKPKGPSAGQSGACEWPTSSSLTARLRRLITAYQRSYRREQLKVEAAEKGDRRRRRCEQASKLKEIARQERQQRWTRREECDFYRVVSTFGVERIKKEADAPDGEEPDLEWTRFRTFARLDKKTDESLSRYFRCFMAMCRRVCHLRPACGEDPSELGQSLAPITEERASRTLYRISLLRRLRERVLPHPSLEERLLLAPPSSELPAWWSTPAHDRELMLGAALHGVSRTELSVFSDPRFSFSQARNDYLENQQNQPAPATPLLPPQAEEGCVVKEEEDKEPGILGDPTALGHADAQTTPLSRPDVKARVRSGLGWKKNRVRDPRGEGRKGGSGGGGMSDSDSDSDSGSSSSSQRSGSSDDSGDSDAERDRGEWPITGSDPGEVVRVSFRRGLNAHVFICCDCSCSENGGRRREQLALDDSISGWCDRVLINRLDSLCTLVLSGQWPTGRRYTSDAQLHPYSEDVGAGDELSFTRLMRKGNSTPSGEAADGGLKLTFSKHALMSNGSGGEGSGRRKRRDQDVCIFPRLHIQLLTPTLSLPTGERAPRRRDLPNWLKENPDYEVEGDMLELLVNRSKRKRRRKRTEKAAALSGSEKVKIIDMRTGKKVGEAYGPTLPGLRVFLEENPDYAVAPEWAETVRSSVRISQIFLKTDPVSIYSFQGVLPDSLLHRLLSTHSVIPKRGHHHHHRHHHQLVPQPTPLEDPLLGGGEETLVSDGAYMMEDEDLEDSSFLTQAFDVKMEGGDSLSQGGYESSEREALLDDVMVQKDSDSSSSSED
uniref:DNA helicase n=1 Tax=Esox lucius TaxID=8010 RepID=A0A6Q2YKY8_ESOLU